MNDKLNIVYKFSSVWSTLKGLRKEIEAQLKNQSEAAIEAAVMTSAELVENAIKYGPSEISFRLSIEDDTMTIEVTQRAIEGPDLASFKHYITRIQQSSDLQALYTERFMELMNDSNNGPTRLGLIRIAHEGKFALNYSQDNDYLHVIAKRKLEPRGSADSAK